MVSAANALKLGILRLWYVPPIRAVEMAKEFPHAEVVGIDLFPMRPR
jgi:hypothetical protein